MAGEEMVKSKSPELLLSEVLNDIQRLATDPDYRDEEEDIPGLDAVEHLTRIVQQAYQTYGDKLPKGEVSSFSGEVSVTWTLRDRKLRVDVAANGSPRMYFGSFDTAPLHRYSHESPAADDDRILEQVHWLVESPDSRNTEPFVR